MNKNQKEPNIIEYSDAAIKVLHFNREPNEICFASHWHDRVEIIRVKSGKIMVEYCGNIHILNKGEMIIFSPKMVHKGFTTDSNVEYDVLMFDIRFFYNETIVCNKNLPLIFNGGAKFENIIYNIETINCVDNICNNQNLDSFEIVSLIYKLMHLLFKDHLTELKINKQDNITEFLDYIEQNFELDLNTEMLSEKIGYSKEHFCRKFKEVTGTTPMTYLKIFRLSQAVKKLESGNKNISEIALQCGFSDANYFTRCFKSHYGVPPSEYKKSPQ